MPSPQSLACLALVLMTSPVFSQQGPKIEPGKNGFLLEHEPIGTGTAFTVCYSPDGKLVVGAHAKRIFVWNAKSGKLQRSWKCEDSVRNLAFSPDGKLLAGCDFNYGGPKQKIVYLWEFITGKEIWSQKGGLGGWGIQFSPNGQIIMIKQGMSNRIRTWSVQTGQLMFPKYYGKHEEFFRGLCVSPKDKSIAFSPNGKSLYFWDADKKKVVNKELSGATRYDVIPLTFSPDGLLLFTQRGAYDVKTQRHLFDIYIQYPPAFSPDGRYFAQPSLTNCLICETITGKVVHVLKGHNVIVRFVEFAADGKTLVSMSQPPPTSVPTVRPLLERCTRFWDVESGKEIEDFDGPVYNQPYIIDVSPDGKDFAASYWGAVGIWKIPERKERKERKVQLSDETMSKLWAVLLGKDANASFRAIRSFARDPERTLPFFRKRLKPTTKQQVEKWLQALKDDNFARRSKATVELQAVPSTFHSRLRQVAERTESVEVRKRLLTILAGTKKEVHPLQQSAVIRLVRVIEVLERIGNDEAVEILQRFSQDAEGRPETIHARRSLRRLKSKNSNG
ncbi:MAG: hypothetical protein ACFCD0_11160 [Gemmataceae bacterium]